MLNIFIIFIFLINVYMELYWKVHINKFDKFVEFILKRYKGIRNKEFNSFKNYYSHINNDGRIYLYLLINSSDCDDVVLSYLYYNDYSKNWLISINWCYMGEFEGRMDKLVKLNNISKV